MSQIDRAAALLFPGQGRRALDVKFFGVPSTTADLLAEQVLVCLAIVDDSSCNIENVDHA